MAGWVAKELLVLFVPVLASKGTLYSTYYLPSKIQLGRGRLFIQIHHRGTLLSLSTQLVIKWSIAMFGLRLSQSRQVTASPLGRHTRKKCRKVMSTVSQKCLLNIGTVVFTSLVSPSSIPERLE